MMTIKTEECHTLFSELKTGDIFSFTAAPDLIYIKTLKSYSIDYECEECNEEGSIDMGDYCVELTTGTFYEANSYERVVIYKKAELTLSR